MTQVTPLPKKKRRKKSERQKMIAKCDKVCGQIVRSVGYCESGRPDEKHGGPIQWSHGHSRGYLAVRWDHRNSWAICRDCHAYYGHRDLEWKDWMRARLGDAEFDALWKLALTHRCPDLNETYAELSALWKQIEAAA